MDGFLEQMRTGARKIAVTGHFGSGKTEFAVSLAFALAAAGGTEALALCDLDIENPYFRSRERQDALRQAGIQVWSDPSDGRNGSELQTISAKVRAPLEDANCRVILDCGGDGSGAMILRQFAKYFAPGDHRLLCVVNPNRPGTDAPEKAADHLRAIEGASGLAVTGLISNAHFIYDTTAETVRDGWAFTKEVEALTGVPALCACCMRALLPELAGCGFPLFPVGMYMRDSYLDKPV